MHACRTPSACLPPVGWPERRALLRSAHALARSPPPALPCPALPARAPPAAAAARCRTWCLLPTPPRSTTFCRSTQRRKVGRGGREACKGGWGAPPGWGSRWRVRAASGCPSPAACRPRRLLPNVAPLPLCTASLPPPPADIERPVGVLVVKVVEATRVPRMDFLTKSQPFVELWVRWCVALHAACLAQPAWLRCSRRLAEAHARLSGQLLAPCCLGTPCPLSPGSSRSAAGALQPEAVHGGQGVDQAPAVGRDL